MTPARLFRIVAAGMLLAVVVTAAFLSRGQASDDAVTRRALPEPSVEYSVAVGVEPPEPTRRTPAPATEDTVDTTAIVDAEATPTMEPQSPPSPEVLGLVSVAEQAVRAWQSPDDRTRTDALTALATPAYQEAAVTIDATRVPSAPLDRVSLQSEADGQALVSARLDDGTSIAVVLVLVEDRWLVDDLRPVAAVNPVGVP